MSVPISACDLRKALDTNNWKEIDEAMHKNNQWGAFSIFPCDGHASGEKCAFTEEETNIINKHLGLEDKRKGNPRYDEQGFLKKENLLFICSGNIDRSPCAEELFRDYEKYNAKSAGVGPLTENPVTKEMIDWADIIFVMEGEHKRLLSEKFSGPLNIVVLDIPNTFLRHDPELEKVLREKLEGFLE